jgi:maleate cis-trans isomerase
MKIGLIALSTDLTIERDFHKYCSHEVYTTRIIFKNPLTPENLSLLQDQIKDAKLRFPFEMDRYVFGCTSGTAVIGEDNVQGCLNPLSSCLSWLQKNNKNELSLLTPYPKDVHEAVKGWFIKKDVKVVNDMFLDYSSDIDIANINRQELVEKVSSLGQGIVFSSCTALPMMDIINSLQKNNWLSSNQAMIWQLQNENN